MIRPWQELQARRPRRPFLVWSLRLFLLLLAGSWLLGDFQLEAGQWARRGANLERFLSAAQPWPVQQGDGWARVPAWATGLWRQGGGQALAATFALSLLAMVLAGMLGTVMSLPAARNLAAARPFLDGGRPPGPLRRLLHGGLVAGARLILILLRSIPEYVWAFLFLAVLGPTAWPLVLALGLHNAGILGKLGAEVVENTDRGLATLRALGASRPQIVLAGVLPLAMPRFLLYFFYRWETCVREATVLGMLGVASLGFLVVEARAHNRYDEMLFFILLGIVLVVLGDLASALLRRWVRRS